jgi:hypothetical protein
MSDQRHRRITTRFRRTIRVDLAIEGMWQSAESVDLSIGGVCLRTPVALPPDQELGLRLHLPGCAPIECRGQVCWTQPDQQEAGVQLMEMGAFDLLIWAQWLKETA